MKIAILFLLFSICYSYNIFTQNVFYDAVLISDVSKDINALESAKSLITGVNLKKKNDEIKQKFENEQKAKIRTEYKPALDTINNVEAQELLVTKIYQERIINNYFEAKQNQDISFKPFSKEEIIFIDSLLAFIKNPFKINLSQYRDSLGHTIKNIYTKITIYNTAAGYELSVHANSKQVAVINFGEVNTSVNQSTYIVNSVKTESATSNSVVSNNFYDALASFLVDRFKEEVVLETVDKVKHYFRNNEILFKYFIPRTYDLIKDVNFSQFVRMSDLKSSLVEDFNDLPINGKNFIVQNSYTAKVPELDYLILGISVWESLKDGQHPIRIILESEAQIFKMFKVSSSPSPYVELIKGLDKYFRVIQDDNKKELKWTSREDIENLSAKEKAFLVCLFDDYTGLKSKASFETKYNNVILSYQTFLNQLEKVQNSINKFNSVHANSEDKIQEYIDKSFELFTKTMSVYNLFTTDTINTQSLDIHYTNIRNIYKAVIKKNYTYATIIFMNKYLKPSIESFVAAQYEGAHSLNTVMRYVGFASEMASTQSGEEMKTVIENFALPPLSIKSKRKSEFDISLVGSPGLMFGAEFGFANENRSRNGIYGITVPVGLDFSWNTSGDCTDYTITNKQESGGNAPLGPIERNESSVGFTITILDLAAIFKYRFGNSSDELKDVNKLTFENLFSPGFIFKYGFSNSPISIGVGIQWIPKLREINQGEAIIKSNSLTLGLNLNWDIGLVNLYRTGF